MILRSTESVGGDAHYWSGGNFRIEHLDQSLNSLTSPYDPIIRANGDVTLSDYQGASLHIIAGGSVDIPGRVQITGADNLATSLSEEVELQNGTKILIDGSAEPTLDIRAGVDQAIVGTPGVLGTVPGLSVTNKPTNADIRIGSVIFAEFVIDLGPSFPPILINPLAGKVLLTNQYQPNNGLSGNIQIENVRTNGGEVYLDAREDIQLIDSG